MGQYGLVQAYLDNKKKAAAEGGIEEQIRKFKERERAGEKALEEQRGEKMKETLLNKYGPDQLSYYVEDLEKAAEEFKTLFGAGPFIKMGPLRFEKCIVRGEVSDPEIEIALGMWGQIQVELIHKLNDATYLFDEYGWGFNHINVVVDDYHAAIKEFEDAGYKVGMYMESSGKPIAYVDCMDGDIGHCIEIHEQNPVVALTKKAVEIWDGKDTFIDIKDVMAAMKG